MSYNNRKIIALLFEEIDNLEERYRGYKDDIRHTLAEILNLEREHSISRINIVQKITDQVTKVGKELYRETNPKESNSDQ
ncbi:MAG: hypothetical protein WD604_07875 [Balneolaceae bacterium]